MQRVRKIVMQIFSRLRRRLDAAPNPTAVFDSARALAASRQVIVVRPDLSLFALEAPAANSMPQNVVEQMESIVPASVKRNIAVITSTSGLPSVARAEVGSPAWVEVGNAIPFFGLLNGLACIGHTVWVADCGSAVEAVCKNADIVIIDSVVSDAIQTNAVRRVMRGSDVFVHDRATFRLRPAVLEPVGWESAFESARAAATRRQIVLVQPDRSLIGLPCIPVKAMTNAQLAQAHRIIPEGAPRTVAVMAQTRLAPDPPDSGGAPALARIRAAGKAIPFFGLLLNLASAGNPVWIFEANNEAVTFGCLGADLLFIDSIFADQFTTTTIDKAASKMRSSNILVYDRGSKNIRILRHVGPSKEKLEFRD